MRIEPTTGRVMLYRPGTSDPLIKEIYERPGARLAATVAWVNDDGTVNLVVFNKFGIPHPRLAVHVVQPDDETQPDERTSFAEWMPFQKGQAAIPAGALDELRARVEQLEALRPDPA